MCPCISSTETEKSLIKSDQTQHFPRSHNTRAQIFSPFVLPNFSYSLPGLPKFFPVWPSTKAPKISGCDAIEISNFNVLLIRINWVFLRTTIFKPSFAKSKLLFFSPNFDEWSFNSFPENKSSISYHFTSFQFKFISLTLQMIGWFHRSHSWCRIVHQVWNIWQHLIIYSWCKKLA